MAAGGEVRSGGVGPPRPARSPEDCDSGERVTQPERTPAHDDGPRPSRAHGFVKRPSYELHHALADLVATMEFKSARERHSSALGGAWLAECSSLQGHPVPGEAGLELGGGAVDARARGAPWHVG